MSSGLLLALIAFTFYGYELAPYKWEAFTGGMAALIVILLWQIRGPRFTFWWLTCMWGIFEAGQTAACRSITMFSPVTAGAGKGVCDVLTGISLTSIGLKIMAALALFLLLRGRHGTTTRS